MLRRVLIVGAFLLVGLPVVAVVAALAIANTDWGRARIVAAMVAATAGGPVQVRVERLSGPLPGRIGLEGVRLSDRGGIFATFDRIDLAWSPLALFGGRLSVQSLEIAGGLVSRAPDLPTDPAVEPPPPSAPSLAFPALPLAIDVDAVRISGVELGAGLAGRPAMLSADLAAVVAATSATAAGWIEARSPDGAARLDLDLAVVPEDGTLRAEIRASEPEGGLVAGLIGLPDRPALELTLTGNGTLADWKGRLEGGFGPDARVDAALSVAATEAGTRLVVDGTAAVQALLPAAARPLVGRSPEIGMSVRLGTDGSISVEEATLRTPAANLRGTAGIDAAGVPVAAVATVSLPDLRVFSAVAGVELAGNGEVRLTLSEQGRRADLGLTGSPSLGAITLDGLRLDLVLSAAGPLAGLPEAVDWTLDGSVATPPMPGPDLVLLLGPRIALQGAGSAATDGSSATVKRLAVIADGARVDATAGLDDDGRRVDARGTIVLTDLQRLSGLADRPLAGSAELGFDGSVLLDPLDISAVLDVTASDLDPGDPALARLVGAAPSASAGVTFDAGNRLAIHGLTLQVATGRAEGDVAVDLSAGGLDGRIDLSAPDLAAVGRALAIDLAGSARAAVALGGTLDAPTASASWRAAPLVVQGNRVTDLTGSATVVGLPASPSGRLDLRAAAGGETVDFGTNYALAGQTLRLDGLALQGAGLTAGGAASVDLAGPSVDGALSLAAGDLGRLGSATGLPLSGGSLDAKLTLADRNGQSAELSGTVTGLALDGGATRIAGIELSGEGHDLLSKPAGTLRVKVGGIRQDGAAVLETATLTIDSDGADARAELALSGGEDRPFAMSATASAALDAAPVRASIDTLQAEVGDVRIALTQPTRITLGSQPRFDDLSLSVDSGRITGGGRVDPADLDVAIAVRDLPAQLARLADPHLKLTGGIDADLKAAGSLADPKVRLTVSVPALRSTDPSLADVPPLKASAEVRIEDRKLTASADASVGEGAELALRATVGLAGSAGGALSRLDESGPLQARLDAEVALERLSAFLPLQGGRLGGQASVHLVVNGTAADPSVSGTAELTDGIVEQPAVGLYLRDVTLVAQGRGERLEIETLSASAVGGGTVEGSGGISFDVAAGAPADMRLAARRLRAIDTDEAEIDIDADLTFQGRLPEYRLAGTVTVLPSEIRIPDQLPTSVVELEITEVRNGVVVRSPEPEVAVDRQGDAAIVLDVAVEIPGMVFIRGRGLESEWGGRLAVTGHIDAPAVNGALEVRRGRLGALGRSFEFQRGRVVFDGGGPDNPALDMILATEVAEIVAKVEVSGRAQDPEIALTSEPTLPEEEVLSRILFGSSRAQLSPLQALRLVQSAAVLSGRLGSGGGITDTVRETLGVDTLDVDTGGGEGSRGASLSVGKYVAPGVFLKLQQGLGGAGSKAVVEVELTDSITVETDVGADSQSRVGVNWKVDY